jgi:hypothetical protein
MTMNPASTRATSLLFSIALAGLVAGCGPDDTTGGGECNFLAGDLVITEVYANPAGDDPGNEWFEIYNASAQTLNLKGLLLVEGPTEDMSADDTHEMTEIVIEPGQYMALGGVLDEFKPDYIDYAYADAIALGNSNRFIALRCGTTTVDEITYTSSPNAKSIGLSGNITPSHIENDNPDNWCDATTEFAPGSDGTPGAANDICDNIAQTECDDGGTVRDVATPVQGQLIISEYMPDPEGADSGKEWLELAVPTDAGGAIALNGVKVEIVGKTSFTFNDTNCLSLSPGEFFVVGGTDVATDNGGLPRVDYVHANIEFFNSGENRTLTVTAANTVISQATYTDPDPTEGTALQIDASGVQCDAIEIYGTEGNLGTPGAANRDCGINIDGMCKDSVSGTFRDIRPPGDGDVQIIEFMAGPLTAESDEWFEVTTDVVAGIDLNGVHIGDETPEVGLISSLDNSCIEVFPGDNVLIAKEANALLPGAVIPSNWGTLNNSTDSITMTYQGGPVASLDYGGGGEPPYKKDVSTQIDTDGDVCLSDTIQPTPPTFGSQTGSPGDPNPQCP